VDVLHLGVSVSEPGRAMGKGGFIGGVFLIVPPLDDSRHYETCGFWFLAIKKGKRERIGGGHLIMRQ
jgi:hypothetical protein